MTRRIVEMKYMTDDKKRKKTYKTRKQGLIKKLHELTTLCDVKACAIIYDESSNSPEVWPPNSDEDVRLLIDKYRAQTRKMTYGLSDFYNGKKRKHEEDLCTIRKKNREAKYPTWVEPLNALKEPELREFAASLESKIVDVKARIEELKKSRSDGTGLISLMNQQQQQGGVFSTRPLDMFVPPHGYSYYYSNSSAIDQQQYQSSVNPIIAPSMMTMLTSGCNSDQGLYESVFGQNQSAAYNIDGQCMMTMLTSSCNSDQGLYESVFGHGTVEPTVCNGLPMLTSTSCYVQQPPEWLQFLPRENFAAQGSY